MISLSFSLEDLALRPDQIAAIEQGGALPEEEVYFQYLCSTIDGGHNPNSEPDDRVRPAHRALHGTIWKLNDPLAPVPPLSWGCRCGMRYVAKPGTIAELVLGAAAQAKPRPVNYHFAQWLSNNVQDWESAAEMAKKLPPKDRLGAIYLWLQEYGIAAARDIARMVAVAADLAG